MPQDLFFLQKFTQDKGNGIVPVVPSGKIMISKKGPVLIDPSMGVQMAGIQEMAEKGMKIPFWFNNHICFKGFRGQISLFFLSPSLYLIRILFFPETKRSGFMGKPSMDVPPVNFNL